MIALMYLLGFVCGAFFYYALSLIACAKSRKEKSAENPEDAMKNILYY